jgi:hypothetical protein
MRNSYLCDASLRASWKVCGTSDEGASLHNPVSKAHLTSVKEYIILFRSIFFHQKVTANLNKFEHPLFIFMCHMIPFQQF